MAQVVNETDKLTYILTSYGLERVTEALADQTIKILLTHVKVGDANGSYYEPTEAQTTLVHPLEGGTFPILDKELLEDRLTVSLHAVFPETFDNCEIREVGIYETVDNEEKLFAISTQQPLIKPSMELRYFTIVDYYAFLKSQNLADIYDQIILDPNNQLITREEFDALMSTVLFTEANLIEQINGNSRVIGLNRAQQLQDQIEKGREDFGYVTAYNNYSLLTSNFSTDDIFGYWLFNYPRRTSPYASVVDINKFGRNLSCDLSINSYQRVYKGLMPTLTFSKPHYYYMTQEEEKTAYNPEAFTITGYPTITLTGIASGFSSVDYVTATSLTLATLDTLSLYLNFTLTDLTTSQTIAFTDNPYSMLIYFDSSDSKIKATLGDGTQWITNLSFTANAQEYSIRLTFNDSNASLSVLEGGVYEEKMSDSLSVAPTEDLGLLTLGAEQNEAAFLGEINLKNLIINNNNVQIFSGSTYISNNNLSFVNKEGTKDIDFSVAYALEPLETNKTRTILARSNYGTNTNVFEINETGDKELQIKLFSDSSNYVTFTSGLNTIPEKAHSVAFSYNANNTSITAFVGNKKVNMKKSVEGTYTHMNTTPSSLYAFTCSIIDDIWADNNSTPTILYNSDGTPYTGSDWVISEGVIFFGDGTALYNSGGNVITDLLYCWDYFDGLNHHQIYTKTLSLQLTTPLYNSNYTLYTPVEGEPEFKIILSGSDYIIQYGVNTTTYTESSNIQPKTLYNFEYTEPMRTIWANSSAVPTLLYNSNGDLYKGTEWSIVDNIIYYKEVNEATYNSIYNIAVPSLPVTSYITGVDGNPDQYINSNIGILTVIKRELDEEKLRAFCLNLEATIGNNPCISTY